MTGGKPSQKVASMRAEIDELVAALDMAATVATLVERHQGGERRADPPARAALGDAGERDAAASRWPSTLRSSVDEVPREVMSRLLTVALATSRHLSHTASLLLEEMEERHVQPVSPSGAEPLRGRPGLPTAPGRHGPLDRWARNLASLLAPSLLAEATPGAEPAAQQPPGGAPEAGVGETRVTLLDAAGFLRLVAAHRELARVPGVLEVALTRVAPVGAELLVRHANDLDLAEAVARALPRPFRLSHVEPGHLVLQAGGLEPEGLRGAAPRAANPMSGPWRAGRGSAGDAAGPDQAGGQAARPWERATRAKVVGGDES